MIQLASTSPCFVGELPAADAHSVSAIRPGRGACRFCSSTKLHTVVDLGMSPLCENFLTRDDLQKMEPFYPLKALVCEDCFLVQVEEYVGGREIFCGDYAYFSSFSDSWLRHAKDYAEMISKRLRLSEKSLVVELASNDGYLLQNFVAKRIPCLGIEPADNVAAAAMKKGVPTRVLYFNETAAHELVTEGIRADLVAANNVLAHVPDLNSFVAGIKVLLADRGVLTVEFPQWLTTMNGNQFDSIYQEHYCYYSFLTAEKIFAAHGITLFDVEDLATHGGSLRIYGRHAEDGTRPITNAVQTTRQREIDAGLTRLDTYRAFAEKVAATKRDLLDFLIHAKREGKRVAAYGAPGKGNTLLNYCGIREDFIDYAVDRNPYKHGKFLPGSHIPVFAPDRIAETRPDYVLILPWNLKEEIIQQLAYVREWGARFVIPNPELTVF
jgi:SAM-dependent methyltransferase